MAKLGDDWMWIGIGGGIIYLLYKLGNPVSKVGDQVSQVTGDVANAVSPWLSDVAEIGKLPQNLATMITNLFNSSKQTVPNNPASLNTAAGQDSYAAFVNSQLAAKGLQNPWLTGTNASSIANMSAPVVSPVASPVRTTVYGSSGYNMSSSSGFQSPFNGGVPKTVLPASVMTPSKSSSSNTSSSYTLPSGSSALRSNDKVIGVDAHGVAIISRG